MNKPIDMKKLINKLEDINEDVADRQSRNRKLLLKSFDKDIAELVQYYWTQAEQIGGDSQGPGIKAELQSIAKEYIL